MLSRLLFNVISENPLKRITITLLVMLVVGIGFTIFNNALFEFYYNKLNNRLLEDGWVPVVWLNDESHTLNSAIVFRDSLHANPTTFLFISNVKQPDTEFSFYFQAGMNCETKNFYTQNTARKPKYLQSISLIDPEMGMETFSTLGDFLPDIQNILCP